ncbi:deoxyribonucleotide triphosphate pyrophosphatase [Neoasaia chiangmaiensis NBRC 101099]|uniref:dITP/XTP pyrophosphatase n=1 Tax=Neoasaia chiangmaiensis TaxID=320497 RepID=A0A1U9KPX4_9PROT|nr:RdgB/HAM1 family non-canonical purine NTP pyrophosphatase [Neoasaia chiangmaiensis]AQS87864.1 non-canonical purine NTP pyrophosphatase [Neoasaia chiangmaiensis]GBR36795.1 deoxyribonucleotide triphosphate pyrophosphatase [Neoasaia chiangmaiensis NBRC 101099]
MKSDRRLARGARIVLASHNKGKLAEFAALLKESGITVVSAADMNLPEPDETADSFEGNAAIKALAAARATGLPALADDSGFCVAALDGRPGVYSARWGGPERDFDAAMARVNVEIGTDPDRRAAFVAVLCLAWPDGTTHTVEGRCDGHAVWPPRGEHGHGYDPIFVPEGETRSFAEMSGPEKNAISHRGRALERFLAECVA